MKELLRLVVSSTNPVKLRAVENGVRDAFPDLDATIASVAVDSGVSDQPATDAETRIGAENRARAARDAEPEADYWFGVEGGVEDSSQGMLTFAWIVVVDRDGRVGRARSAAFVLPEAVAGKVRGGMELGHADDEVFGRTDSKRQDGAIGLLTAGALDRAGLYAPAVTAAMIPFLNPGLYPVESG
ncbi:inosine/xanthosine triphosphatase [Wenzhouxiangella sp. XN79A]|uniref:inosine/xanthosine triphosphatase n=1 Tax=Wenzhouxiangella sp. XN79A TaxID=2724193 RepID=UPI00144A5F3F|nr:inosine/xanthosine triphosphatase [Wenzhouxiangella sp. XN79A]NKI33859.1 inosine/xanthosine triphosphatase [Wenzhouxiangella sp. XN79A]